ncbi:HU family DNA-binding protein [Fusobacterium sp.]|uniref:HU family DNA-binding protein n=1 Tax=Fusobacterium sp. TaxID=68766 RepID=UPI002904625A|nr:HU family DNA-binding protein [Fusobacterium sp.]MDU1910615.1 HU family DNA-binding protein [Fusobacterium sp.]
MNKRELAKIYRRMNSRTLTVKKAKKEIEAFIETLEEALLVDGEVRFVKRGVFDIFSRQPKLISNPSTGEHMTIYPKKTVRFRASKNLLK